MGGSFTYTPPGSGVQLARPADIVVVALYNGPGDFELLPNIRCISVDLPSEGASTGAARFRYAFGDPNSPPDCPQRIEEVYPLDAQGNYVVENDDRLVVYVYTADGDVFPLFDGFASLPQADWGESVESVTFEGLGTPVREFDWPLGGAVMRDADKLTTPNKNDIDTQLPARFNPDGRPNATPAPDEESAQEDDSGDEGSTPFQYDSGEDPNQYPVFCTVVWPPNAKDAKDPDVEICQINGETIREWNVSMAARYIIAVGNPDQEWTEYSSFDDLDWYFGEPKPTTTNGPINLSDQSTFTMEPIPVEDLDVTGEPWPVALERLLKPTRQLAFCFRLESDDEGNPSWQLDLYRRDDPAIEVKQLYLQPAGDNLDPAGTNVAEMRLARDAVDVVNYIDLDTAPTVIENSLILWPGFKVEPGDFSSKEDYIEGNPNFDNGNQDKYRTWIYDECGEGHWSFADDDWDEGEAGDLQQFLQKGVKGKKFVNRRRPAEGELVSKDDEGKPLRPQLWVCADYSGNQGNVWDTKSGTWELVPDGNWTLLPDRLGIRFTTKDPNSVPLGSSGSSAESKLGGKLNLVDWIADGSDNPLPSDAGSGPIVFRLTCALKNDQDLSSDPNDPSKSIFADRRASSVTEFTVRRHHDVRDRYGKTIIGRYSHLADPADLGSKDKVVRDDTKDAQAHADQLRRAREAGSFAGSVTMTGIRTGYLVGDLVDTIVGRDISLRSNLGASQNEGATYPAIVGVHYDLDGEVKTVLTLDDHRADPAPRRRRREREL